MAFSKFAAGVASRAAQRRRRGVLPLAFLRAASSAPAVAVAPAPAKEPAAAPELPKPESRFVRFNSPVPMAVDLSPILSVPATRVTTLPNGLRVATEAHPSAQTATVGVWIDAGSRYETEQTSGTAHFLEHILFKGTKRRTQGRLEVEVENAGAQLNAYTSREMTTYLAHVVKRDVTKAVDILADILQHSEFDAEAIDRERKVILREMQEVNQNTSEVVFDHLHATAFQYSPLGRTILGSADNIRSITADDLKTYIQTHYTAPRMVVAAAGAVDHDELVKLVEKQFSNLSTEPTTKAELVKKEPSIYTGSDVRIRDDDHALAHFALAVKGASWGDPDAVALMVMHNMLGSYTRSAGGGVNLGSKLCQNVAANSLAESVMAFTTNYSDVGLFGVYCVAPSDTLEDLSWCIMDAMTGMVYKVAEDDVVRAKNQLKSSLLIHLNGPSHVAEDIGRQLLTYGRRLPLAEMFARIDAVDAETVKRVAERFFFDKDVVLAAIGPIQYLPDYMWLRRRTYWIHY